MRRLTDVFKVNGRPMFAPDEGMEISYEDLDAADSGRDECGVMHRIVVRYKLGSWSFCYSHMTEAEKRYTEALFGDEAEFDFTHPDRITGEAVTCRAYRSKYGAAWKNAATGQWRNYKFNIIQV